MVKCNCQILDSDWSESGVGGYAYEAPVTLVSSVEPGSSFVPTIVWTDARGTSSCQESASKSKGGFTISFVSPEILAWIFPWYQWQKRHL